MNIRDVIEGIARRMRRGESGLPDDVVDGFLRVLEEIRLRDMPCSQVFARLDEYVEKEVSSHQAARLMPLLREHLDLCPNCSEQYEALLTVLERTASQGETHAA
jgi:hypothetical protein